jgi:hypothetical protein
MFFENIEALNYFDSQYTPIHYFKDSECGLIITSHPEEYNADRASLHYCETFETNFIATPGVHVFAGSNNCGLTILRSTQENCDMYNKFMSIAKEKGL